MVGFPLFPPAGGVPTQLVNLISFVNRSVGWKVDFDFFMHAQYIHKHSFKTVGMGD